jgi:hypothetical protein
MSIAKSLEKDEGFKEDFLNPKKIKTANKKAVYKKEKPVSHFPIDSDVKNKSLSDLMDELAAANSVINSAALKVLEHKSTIKNFLLENFAKNWAREKERPPTRTWKALRSSVDYVMTSYVNFTAEKQEKIEKELKLDMSDQFEVTGFQIDFEKIKQNKIYFDAFLDFISKISKEDLDSDEFISRKFKLKEGFFNNLAEFCDNNPDRLYNLLQILEPRANFKNILTSDSEENLFDFVKKL